MTTAMSAASKPSAHQRGTDWAAIHGMAISRRINAHTANANAHEKRHLPTGSSCAKPGGGLPFQMYSANCLQIGSGVEDCGVPLLDVTLLLCVENSEPAESRGAWPLDQRLPTGIGGAQPTHVPENLRPFSHGCPPFAPCVLRAPGDTASGALTVRQM